MSFHKTTRLGDEKYAVSLDDLSNDSRNDYLLNSIQISSPAERQRGTAFEKGLFMSSTPGFGYHTIDADSSLRLTDRNYAYGDKRASQPRIFSTTPYLGKGYKGVSVGGTFLESSLIHPMMSSVKRSQGDATEKIGKDIQPLCDTMQGMFDELGDAIASFETGSHMDTRRDD